MIHLTNYGARGRATVARDPGAPHVEMRGGVVQWRRTYRSPGALPGALIRESPRCRPLVLRRYSPCPLSNEGPSRPYYRRARGPSFH